MSDSEEETEALRAEMAALQARMDARLDKKEKERRIRKAEDAKVLVQDTPTKASSREGKRQRSYSPPAAQPKFISKKPALGSEHGSRASTPAPAPPPESGKSSMAARLAGMHREGSSGSSRSSRAGSALPRVQPPPARPSTSRERDPAPAPAPLASSNSNHSKAAAKRRTDDLEATLAQDKYGKKPVQKLPSLPARRGISSAAPPGRPSHESASASSKPSSSKRLNPAPYPTAASSRARAERERSDSLEVEDKKESYRRDDVDSTLIEELERGPKEFGRDPEGDDEWASVEPNSGIRLRKRTTPHKEVQEFLTGRYYLPPSKIYSVARLTRDGTSYDVPVDDEWLTIAVVAQRGPIRVSGTKVKTEKNSDDEKDEDDDDDEGDEEESEDDEDDGEQAADIKPFIGTDGKAWKPKPKQKAKKSKEDSDDDWKKKRGPRKYINLTLCAMPRRSYGSTSSTGDVLLHMLLFEADHVVAMEDGEGGTYKSYRGGSGGAYEKWCNIAEGSVIAILNPRVWRNLRGGSHKPHPMESPLGLNPFSDDSIMLIGQSRDLGHCSAIQRDGNRCKSWIDTRLNAVCEYHLHAAVKRGKAGRGEFTASTNAFHLTHSKSQVGNAPTKPRKGLLPANGRIATPRGEANGGGGATYVVGGGVIHTGGPPGDENVADRLGRGRAGKKRRKVEQQEAERDLQKLFEREKAMGGGGTTGGRYLNVIKRYEGKTKEKDGKDKEDKDQEDEEEKKTRVFSAEAIKKIGFDPSARAGQLTKEEDRERVEAIATLEGLSAKGTRDFTAKRKREASAVPQPTNNPPSAPAKPVVPSEDDDMIDLDD
ncbi:hypothetical protein B9479_004157 [Cryptococcus floricola]|uniref:Zinc finger Mcm10/DnaG-type domain-containing protein n=1 Tax=Cryptococcus floricola TaxID=2591691 RepID=A0A5D3AY14_9TREE|nr:hypothetical protein B9479_004157 [Cryptococcus floricola]